MAVSSGRLRMMMIGPMLLLVLVACQPPPGGSATALTYQGICGLEQGQIGSMDEQGVLQWIEEHHGTPLPLEVPDLGEGMPGGTLAAYGWDQPDGRARGIAYLHDGRLVSLSFRDLEHGPTFGQVVAGLGSPEAVYRTMLRYEQVLYRVGLDYPALGISVQTSGIEDWQTLGGDEGGPRITLTETMPVTDIECFQPGALKQTLHENLFWPDDIVSSYLQRQIPWPGFGETVPLDTK